MPRIVAANPQLEDVIPNRNGDVVPHVQIDQQRVRANGINVVPQRSQDAGNIRRATGAAEPALTHRFHVVIDMVEGQRFRVHFQRIHIKEMLTVQRHAAQHRVVQRTLHHVGVVAVCLHLQHPAGKHHQANGGAAFRIYRIVGQIVIAAERLAAALRANPAGNVQLALRHVVPQPQTVLAFAFVIAQARQVRHARHQVDETHRMADGRLLFGKGLMRLAVGFVLDHPRRAIGIPVGRFAALLVFNVVEVRLRAAFLNEIFHHVEIALLLRDVVQPHQRQLDFRVSRIAVQLRLAWAKHAVDMVRQPAHHVQQAALSGSLEIRHARFNHMSGAVQFVAFRQIGPALLGGFHREIGIEITIFALRRRDQFNHLVGGFFQFSIRLLAQGPCHGFEPFRHVTVLKYHPVKLPLFQTGRDAEVGDGVAGFGLCHAVVKRLPLVRDHHVTDQPLVLTKKRVVDFQLVKVGFHYGHIVLLRTVHDAGANRWQCATSRDC